MARLQDYFLVKGRKTYLCILLSLKASMGSWTLKFIPEYEISEARICPFWTQWMLNRCVCGVCTHDVYGNDVLIEPWKPPWASLVSHLPPCSALSLSSARTIVQGKSGHIVLIAIKLKQKGRDTNTEIHLASGEITIFYFAFWEGQKVMTGIWPLITSLMLCVQFFF